jgi:hypothetical protein
MNTLSQVRPVISPCRREHAKDRFIAMKQGTLFYDKECGRYNFIYKEEDGDDRDYGGIH